MISCQPPPCLVIPNRFIVTGHVGNNFLTHLLVTSRTRSANRCVIVTAADSHNQFMPTRTIVPLLPTPQTLSIHRLDSEDGMRKVKRKVGYDFLSMDDSKARRIARCFFGCDSKLKTWAAIQEKYTIHEDDVLCLVQYFKIPGGITTVEVRFSLFAACLGRICKYRKPSQTRCFGLLAIGPYGRYSIRPRVNVFMSHHCLHTFVGAAQKWHIVS